jgi:hypothetical protein
MTGIESLDWAASVGDARPCDTARIPSSRQPYLAGVSRMRDRTLESFAKQNFLEVTCGMWQQREAMMNRMLR